MMSVIGSIWQNPQRHILHERYHKLVDKTEKHRIAIITGTIGDDTYITIISDLNDHVFTREYPFTENVTDINSQSIKIGENQFGVDCIKVDICAEPEKTCVNGTLKFTDIIDTTDKHSEIVLRSFSHMIEGILEINGQVIDFTGGYGYTHHYEYHQPILAMVGMQSNHFTNSKANLETNIWVNTSLLGTKQCHFQCRLWHGGKLHVLAQHARVEQFMITDHTIYLTLRDHKYYLEIIAERTDQSLLRASHGNKYSYNSGTLNSMVFVRLTGRVGNSVQTIFEDTGRNTALNIMGDIDELLQFMV